MGPISHPRLQDGTAAATTKGASVRGAAKKLVLFVIWSVGGAAGLGSRHSGSSLPPSHPFGRDDIGNGQKEGEGGGRRKGKRRKEVGDREAERGRGREGLFLIAGHSSVVRARSLRLPLRSLHCFSPE